MIKKYFYYFVIVIVILHNYNLVQKYDKNEEKYKSLNTITDYKEEKILTADYLTGIADSKYIDSVANIEVSGTHTNITIEVKKDYKYKDIVNDFEKALNKIASHVNITDDKNMVLEFE